MNTLTIIILLVIIVFGLIGHARGFVRMLLSVFSLALTLFLATVISPTISEALQKTNLYDSVYDSTYEYVNDKIIQTAADSTEGLLDELQLPKTLKDYIGSSQIIAGTQQDIAR